ncbi:blue (type 1) copper domain protein [Gemmatirosa kalamazoonensis]|uniref:Blue (Type 1) copper domain protein n=1 Tax=Gemmatirosa kalamazoonensis TaxID=861299 RepID=W0RGA2_9BACT|nr:plastocyanin/azurin family copper-binding protein [Gemmatirosa kalamazoonensis]AHG89355.1 blue (type 1) copper domain protein [Gemmatirosa kalamazoonensis]
MRRIPLLTAVALVATACFSEKPEPLEPGAPSTGAVTASSTANSFTPQILNVLQGGTVTWTFGTRPHNVTFVQTAGAPQNVPTTTSNTASRTFASPGTFAYVCTLHAGMVGTVNVVPAPTQPTR